MIIFILTIAGGNSTALISSKKNNILAGQLLKKVEQVGFIQENKLEMMGGELCINATLAFSSLLGKKGKLKTSGIKGFVKFRNYNNLTEISLPLKYKINKNLILFSGIGFICLDKRFEKEISKKILKELCKTYNLPAFGIIIYGKNKIAPYVYVREVNSFVKETACGSGSIAYSLFSGYRKIIQPTGKQLSIKIKKDNIIIKAEVKVKK